MQSNTATKAPCLFQCISGKHAGEIKPGTELEVKAMARIANGAAGAIVLNSSECWACVEDARDNQRRNWDMMGCPVHWDERCDCTPKPIPDSPYDKQVGRTYYY